MTAAELRAIGERVASLGRFDRPWTEAERARARLYAVLVGMIDREILEVRPGVFVIFEDERYPAKDAAINALLGGGGE